MSKNKLAAIIIVCTIAIIVAIVLVVPDNNGTLEEAQEYFTQGNVHLEQEQWDEAITAFSEAIELDQAYADAYAKRAVAYNKKGDYYELAILDCEKALELNPSIRLDPSLARAYLHRAEYNAQFVKMEHSFSVDYEDNKANFEKTIADFTKAIELDSRLAEAYKGRADCIINYYQDSSDFRVYGVDDYG